MESTTTPADIRREVGGVAAVNGRNVLEALARAGRPLRPGELEAVTGLPGRTLRDVVTRLTDAGTVNRAGVRVALTPHAQTLPVVVTIRAEHAAAEQPVLAVEIARGDADLSRERLARDVELLRAESAEYDVRRRKAESDARAVERKEARRVEREDLRISDGCLVWPTGKR